jgi:hypothetical protein
MLEDDNGTTCFEDDLGATSWVDDNGLTLTCAAETDNRQVLMGQACL